MTVVLLFSGVKLVHHRVGWTRALRASVSVRWPILQQCHRHADDVPRVMRRTTCKLTPKGGRSGRPREAARDALARRPAVIEGRGARWPRPRWSTAGEAMTSGRVGQRGRSFPLRLALDGPRGERNPSKPRTRGRQMRFQRRPCRRERERVATLGRSRALLEQPSPTSVEQKSHPTKSRRECGRGEASTVGGRCSRGTVDVEVDRVAFPTGRCSSPSAKGVAQVPCATSRTSGVEQAAQAALVEAKGPL